MKNDNSGTFQLRTLYARIIKLIFVNRSRTQGYLVKFSMLMQLKKCHIKGRYSSVELGRQGRNKYIEQKTIYIYPYTN